MKLESNHASFDGISNIKLHICLPITYSKLKKKLDESSKCKREMSKIYKLTVVSNHVARRECDRGTVSDFANEDLNEQMTRREAKIDIQEVVLL